MISLSMLLLYTFYYLYKLIKNLGNKRLKRELFVLSMLRVLFQLCSIFEWFLWASLRNMLETFCTRLFFSFFYQISLLYLFQLVYCFFSPLSVKNIVINSLLYNPLSQLKLSIDWLSIMTTFKFLT